MKEFDVRDLACPGPVLKLRDLLADALGEARPTAEEIEKRMKSKSADTVVLPDPKFVPGSAPSW